MKKRILFLLLLPLFVFAQAQPLQEVKLRLQWKHQFEFAGFYAAKEKGYYKESGLDVKILESNGTIDAVQELLSGDVQFATDYGTFIADIQNGKPLLFVANYLKSSPIAFAVKPGIYSPEQFKGKTIEASKNELESPDIQDFFMINHINIKDMKVINNSVGIENLAKGKADIISIYTTNEPYLLRKRKIPFSIIDPKHYGATSLYDDNLITSVKFAAENPSAVEAFKRASGKGWKYALEHKEEIADLILQKYNTQNKTKEQLLFEAEATENLMQPRLFPIGSINPSYVSKMEELYIKLGIANRFILPSKFIFDPYRKIENGSSSINLTQDEKNYLKDFGPIKMCVDPDWYPLEKINKKGKYIGMGADIVRLYEQFLGQTIILVPTDSWDQTLTYIKERKCDIIPMASPLKSRTQYADFTKPYAKFLNVVSTKNDIPYITDFDAIKNKPIGIVKGYATKELLKERYPGINLVEVNNVQEGLQKVHNGKLFAFVDIVPTIAYAIRDKNFINLKISGDTGVNMPLSIAVRKDKPKLLTIFQKTVQHIEAKDKDNIFNQWTSVLVKDNTDYTYIWVSLSIATAIILLLLWWAYKLKSLNKKITTTKEKLELTLDTAKLTLWSINVPSMNIELDKRHWDMAGYKNMPKFMPIPEFESYLHNHDVYNIQQALKKHLKSQDKYYNTEYRFRNFDNTYTWIQSHGETVEKDKKGNPITIIGVNIDITKQKETENDLRYAKDELNALNSTLKMRINTEVAKNKNKDRLFQITERQVIISEMIDSLISKWKKPIASIRSIGDKLAQIIAAEDPSNTKHLLEQQKNTLIQESGRLEQAIHNLNDFFKISTQNTSFDIKNSIEEIIKLFDLKNANEGFQLTINDSEPIEATGIKNELQQVILSVLKNRTDAFKEKQIIHPQITISIEKQQSNAVIFIKDNGEGMDEEEFGKIFEPYAGHTNELHKSLHSSRLLLEKMGGTIRGVNSSGGSTFIITLKIA